MKKLLFIFSLIGLLAIGCQENFPVQEESTTISSEPNWITFSEPLNASLSKSITKTKKIKASRGGEIWIWEGGRKEKIDTWIWWDKNSWDTDIYGEEVEFTFTADNDNCSSTFGPHIVFTKDAWFSAKYTGLDLSGIDKDNIKFVYQSADGSLEYPEYDRIKVNVKKGTLEIKNARIPHFSRYGFTM